MSDKEKRDTHEILSDRERILKEHPEQVQSFNRFLKDWRRYASSYMTSKKGRGNHSSAFGSTFKREL